MENLDEIRTLLQGAAGRAINYLDNLEERRVYPSSQALTRLEELEGPLPEAPTPAEHVLALLDEVGSPATVASAGGRYFGFVTGGSLPASLAANWLAGAWDQAADMLVASPVGAKIEEVAARWLLEALKLPPDCGVGFVTGGTMANFCGLAAARHAILQRLGWDVERQGLFHAPEIKVVVGQEVHVSLLKALSLLGLGRERVVCVPVDGQGRMKVSALPTLDQKTILCIQAGNVNTGAFDPAAELCSAAHQAGAWVHVDGAFGLWARAAPSLANMAEGTEQADSLALDAHKWLNVPYDSGVVICRDESQLRAAMSSSAEYLVQSEGREPGDYTPEMSRRARGVEVWAALLSLGRSGLADLIERSCRHARRFAEELTASKYAILNEVVLNQVLVTFGKPEITRAVIAALQDDGTCWCGGTIWQAQTAMRISVCGWNTSESDVQRSLQAILRIAGEVNSQRRGSESIY